MITSQKGRWSYAMEEDGCCGPEDRVCGSSGARDGSIWAVPGVWDKSDDGVQVDKEASRDREFWGADGQVETSIEQSEEDGGMDGKVDNRDKV